MTRPPKIHRKKSSRTPAFLLAAGVFFLAIAISVVLFIFRPEAEKDGASKQATAVQVLKVSPENYVPTIPSQGILEPHTRTMATSEVAGKVLELNYRAGETFPAGGTILQIDPADYIAAKARAEADLAQAELNLETELARQEQAIRDWNKLSPGREPSPLTRRDFQVKNAEAQRNSAIAALKKAERDVDRTSLVPPYDGRIVSTETDRGSYVTIGSPLAEFYATDILEVRLPVSVTDFTFLDSAEPPKAKLLVGSGRNKAEIAAEIVRSEGEFDRNSRSAFVVARIHTADAIQNSADLIDPGLLTPGLFVEAAIPGKLKEGVYRVPRKALVENSQLLLVDEKDRIQFREVEVIRLEGKTDMILSADSLNPGERVCLTSLEQATRNMPVRVIEEIPSGQSQDADPPSEVAQP